MTLISDSQTRRIGPTASPGVAGAGLVLSQFARFAAGALFVASLTVGTADLVGGPERLPATQPRIDVVPPEAEQPAPPTVFVVEERDDRTGRRNPIECHARAAEAASLLPTQAWAVWFSLNSTSRSRGRNVATVSYCINNNFGTSAAVSGQNPPAGTIPLPRDAAFPAGVVNGSVRSGDAEFKIANQLYAEFGRAREFSVAYVFSIIEFCSSCEAVLNSYSTQSGVAVVRWDAGLADGSELAERGRELRE